MKKDQYNDRETPGKSQMEEGKRDRAHLKTRAPNEVPSKRTWATITGLRSSEKGEREKRLKTAEIRGQS